VELDPAIRPVVDRLAASLAGQGAQAVVLVGSRATGDATPDSDVDLVAVGDGPAYRLEIQDARLVSISWADANEQRRRMYDPDVLGTHVPGWRAAIVLSDPDGIAERLRQEALEWRWKVIEDDCDCWVAAWVTGLAEEALKVVVSLRTENDLNAAAQRSVLALRLAKALAIHRRILCGSENRLWAIVADELGPDWRSAQASALGLVGADLEASCRSALELFDLAVEEVWEVLDDGQRAVADHARSLARAL
jgi:predicted nucleotidyltransferase